MKKWFLNILVVAFLISCGSSNNSVTQPIDSPLVSDNTATKYANTITADELKTHLWIYASDEFEGRDTGEPGQKMAVNFLKDWHIPVSIFQRLKNQFDFQG